MWQRSDIEGKRDGNAVLPYDRSPLRRVAGTGPSTPFKCAGSWDTKAESRAGRKPMPTYAFRCERCTKSFEVVLTVAERAAAKVACPTCGGGEVTPQMAIFSAKTSRKS